MSSATARRAQRFPIATAFLAVAIALALGLAAAINPILGLGAFLTLAALSAFVRSGVVTVCTFAGATYFDLVGEYTGAAMSPIKLAGGALILMAVVTLAVHRSRMPFLRTDAVARLLADSAPAWRSHPVIVGLVVTFTGWAIASAAWAQNLDQVQSLSTRLVTDALVFLAVPVFLRSADHLRALAWTVLWCAASAVLLGTLLGAEVMGRALGTFTDPNEYAAALVPAIALAVPVVEHSPQALARWTGRFLVAYCLLGVVQSGSRGGMLALAVAFAAIVIGSRGLERIRLAGISLLGAACGLAWLVLTPAGSSIFERITDGDSSGRSSLWLVALRQFRSEPVHGIGIGNYPATAHQYLDGISDLDLFLRDPRVVHSTPLELLAELGAVGFLLYYGFVIGCIWCGVRATRIARRIGHRQLLAVSRGVVAATLSAVASTVFLSGQYQELAWVLCACCVVALGAARREAALQDAAATLADETDAEAAASDAARRAILAPTG